MQAKRCYKQRIGTILLAGLLAVSGSVATPQVAVAASAKVYVAPDSGKKYHSSKDCRGLSNANEIVKMTKKKAKDQGYTKCKICN